MAGHKRTGLSINLDTVAQELGERSDVHNLHEIRLGASETGHGAHGTARQQITPRRGDDTFIPNCDDFAGSA
jgi:hypothetical protein